MANCSYHRIVDSARTNACAAGIHKHSSVAHEFQITRVRQVSAYGRVRVCLLGTRRVLQIDRTCLTIPHMVTGTLDKAGRNTDAGWGPGCGRGFFSRGQLSVQTLFRCPLSPRVQSLASTSERTLKIPDINSHMIVWTHENTAHADRNG